MQVMNLTKLITGVVHRNYSTWSHVNNNKNTGVRRSGGVLPKSTTSYENSRRQSIVLVQIYTFCHYLAKQVMSNDHLELMTYIHKSTGVEYELQVKKSIYRRFRLIYML